MNEVIVSMENICKTFPGVKALDHVNFELRSGEVMALLGENGAGKSTLMKVLSGVYTRDDGSLKIFGKEYGDLTPKQAQEVGVAIIHQELNMCRHLSVAENMFLGREISGRFALNNTKMEQEAKRILDDLKIDIDPKETVGELPVSKQQMVEIAKALSINAKILIMDEPTSSLTAREIEDLFRIIRKLKSEGKGIVYISHRLEELQHIVDRVTIMRDGQYITSMNFGDVSMEQIISHMVGREIKEKFPRVECKKGKKVFEVKHLNAGRMVRDINFTVYEGEIVGFAGLMGAGRTETTRAIFGVDPKESGEIYVDDKKVEIKCPMDAIRNGVVLAPEDRKKDGLCTKLIPLVGSSKMTTLESLASHLPTTTFCWFPPERLPESTSTSGVFIFRSATAFSHSASSFLPFTTPSLLMNELKKQGIAVMFVSSEMPEVMGIADRIIVMCDGRITGEVMARNTTQNEILTLATTFEDKKINSRSGKEEV